MTRPSLAPVSNCNWVNCYLKLSLVAVCVCVGRLQRRWEASALLRVDVNIFSTRLWTSKIMRPERLRPLANNFKRIREFQIIPKCNYQFHDVLLVTKLINLHEKCVVDC